jgi:hypothetical protein
MIASNQYEAQLHTHTTPVEMRADLNFLKWFGSTLLLVLATCQLEQASLAQTTTDPRQFLWT